MLETAMKAARQAGRVLLEARTSHVRVLQQHGADVKLEVDRKAEETILSVLAEAFPGHSILSEEAGRMGPASEWEWVVDPLDGSYNFLYGVPFWSTSIALRKGGEEVVGVVYDPTREEMFHAEKDKGAFLNGRPIRVSGVETVGAATVAFASGPRGRVPRADCPRDSAGAMDGGQVPSGPSQGEEEEYVEAAARSVDRLLRRARKVRALGSAALQLAYVACGRVDAFFEFGVFDWDVAGGALLVREAGGAVSIRRHLDGTLGILATNGRIHRELAGEVGWRDEAGRAVAEGRTPSC